jgi:hypothetical protein
LSPREKTVDGLGAWRPSASPTPRRLAAARVTGGEDTGSEASGFSSVHVAALVY